MENYKKLKVLAGLLFILLSIITIALLLFEFKGLIISYALLIDWGEPTNWAEAIGLAAVVIILAFGLAILSIPAYFFMGLLVLAFKKSTFISILSILSAAISMILVIRSIGIFLFYGEFSAFLPLLLMIHSAILALCLYSFMLLKRFKDES